MPDLFHWLLTWRMLSQRHAMTPEDVYHRRTVGRAAAGSMDCFDNFSYHPALWSNMRISGALC
jgi:hypothetical protein